MNIGIISHIKEIFKHKPDWQLKFLKEFNALKDTESFLKYKADSANQEADAISFELTRYQARLIVISAENKKLYLTTKLNVRDTEVWNNYLTSMDSLEREQKSISVCLDKLEARKAVSEANQEKILEQIKEHSSILQSFQEKRHNKNIETLQGM